MSHGATTSVAVAALLLLGATSLQGCMTQPRPYDTAMEPRTSRTTTAAPRGTPARARIVPPAATTPQYFPPPDSGNGNGGNGGGGGGGGWG